MEADEAIKPLLERIVLADDDELLEAAHAPDLLGEVHASQLVHVLLRLVEEGKVEGGELLEQGQPNSSGGAHLLASAQLGKGAINSLAAQDDLVIVLPRELRATVSHYFAEDTVSLCRDIAKQGF